MIYGMQSNNIITIRYDELLTTVVVVMMMVNFTMRMCEGVTRLASTIAYQFENIQLLKSRHILFCW